ncbi:hypothetical protein I5U56_19530 [Stenotrophomonas maltophilia]|nr:hypothetical protein [Stenotrophomonas maltophilia]
MRVLVAWLRRDLLLATLEDLYGQSVAQGVPLQVQAGRNLCPERRI